MQENVSRKGAGYLLDDLTQKAGCDYLSDSGGIPGATPKTEGMSPDTSTVSPVPSPVAPVVEAGPVQTGSNSALFAMIAAVLAAMTAGVLVWRKRQS